MKGWQIALAYLGFDIGPQNRDAVSESPEQNLAPFVQIALPVITILMFTVLLVSQEAWVEDLARPRWVDSSTGVAVLGWMVGTVLVALGVVRARWLLPIGSSLGLLAQWGDTLGGEVGFDLGFYRLQGIAIGVHLVLSVALALVPLRTSRIR